MALYEMPVQAAGELQAALQVDSGARLPVVQGRFIQRFLYRRHLVQAVLQRLNCKTNAVVRNALVYLKLGGKGDSIQNDLFVPCSVTRFYCPIVSIMPVNMPAKFAFLHFILVLNALKSYLCLPKNI
jgi:hypothetical protein